MSEDSIRNHLRAALDDIISTEKTPLLEALSVEDAIASGQRRGFHTRYHYVKIALRSLRINLSLLFN